jgi:hypothetical protein
MSHRAPTRPRNTGVRRWGLLLSATGAALAVGAGLLAAQLNTPARSKSPGAQPSAAAAADPAVDYTDPDAVCAAFARAINARDTASDVDAGDAYRRAAAYADARYAAAVDEQQPTDLPDWAQWSEHRAVVEVSVTPLAGDVDVDVDTHSSRVVAVTAIPTGRDGWTGPPLRTLITCDMGRTGGGWRVSGYTVQVTL